jgi:eukaryotic-like serine/threonine-protein kinase
VLLDAVLLASAGGSAEAWAELRACSGRRSQEQEAIEVIELHALGALRAGDLQAARRAVEDALAIARKVPNIMEARLHRRLLEIEARQ